MKTLPLLTTLPLALCPAVLAQVGPPSAVVFVDTNATGANTGGNWVDAYTSLEVALSSNGPGTTYWIAEGTYRPTAIQSSGDLRTATFVVEDGDRLFGGFRSGDVPNPSSRTGLAENTILDGNVNPSNPADGVFHVVTALGDDRDLTVINGLHIRGGDATVLAGDPPAPPDGGVYVRASAELGGGILFQPPGPILVPPAGEPLPRSTLFVEGCILRDNRARDGGGIYAQNGSLDVAADKSSGPFDLFTSESLFEGNSALGRGGAICTAFVGYGYTDGVSKTHVDSHIYNTRFADNWANNGGALYLGTPLDLAPDTRQIVANCVLTDNVAEVGGAMYFLNFTPSDVTLCTIAYNAAFSRGGGIYLAGGQGKVPEVAMTISDSIFFRNAALADTGDSDVFVPGGGTICDDNPVVIAHNRVQSDSLQAIISENCDDGVDYSGNIASSPKFVSASNRDFRLRATSPCVDAGDTLFPTFPAPDWFDFDNDGNLIGEIVTQDLDLATRQVGAIDMGAYERQ